MTLLGEESQESRPSREETLGARKGRTHGPLLDLGKAKSRSGKKRVVTDNGKEQEPEKRRAVLKTSV